MNHQTISACMIVKNEEKLLPTCLESIRDYVDEIVIVDTGSTDRTISIAKSFGARVYHHPWEKHFSKHRNQSMEYANGDWLFIIDADEELIQSEKTAIHKELEVDDSIDSVMIRVECASPSGVVQSNSMRFVRNRRNIRYKGRIHNYLVGQKKAVFSNIRLFHHGYNLGEAVDRQKFKRTTELLKLDIEEEPNNPRPYHFLAVSHMAGKKYKYAKKYAKKAIELFENGVLVPHNYLWSLYIAAASCFNLGEDKKTENFAKKAISFSPDHLDSHYILALCGYQTKNCQMFEDHTRLYFEIKVRIGREPERFGEMVHNTLGSEWVLLLYKGFFLMDKGEKNKAEDEFRKGLERCADIPLYKIILGRYFQSSGNPSRAERIYFELLETQPENTEALRALSDLYEEMNRFHDHITCLEKVISIDPDFPGAHFELGLACMNLGQFDRAISLFRKIQAKHPQDHRAKINEAICLRGIGEYEASIRVSLEIETKEKDEMPVIVSNIAHCHAALGHRDQTIKWFDRLADVNPKALEPPVYLSMLYMDQMDIEASVSQCGKLLSLLGMEQNKTLNRLVELGELYFSVGHRLNAMKKEDLARICFDIGVVLGYNDSN